MEPEGTFYRYGQAPRSPASLQDAIEAARSMKGDGVVVADDARGSMLSFAQMARDDVRYVKHAVRCVEMRAGVRIFFVHTGGHECLLGRDFEWALSQRPAADDLLRRLRPPRQSIGIKQQEPWPDLHSDVLDVQRYLSASMTNIDAIARQQAIGPDDMGPRERKRSAPEHVAMCYVCRVPIEPGQETVCVREGGFAVYTCSCECGTKQHAQWQAEKGERVVRSAPETERVVCSGRIGEMTMHLSEARRDVRIDTPDEWITYRIAESCMPQGCKVGQRVEVLDGRDGVRLRVLDDAPNRLSEVRVTSDPNKFPFSSAVACMTEGFKGLGEAAKALEGSLTITGRWLGYVAPEWAIRARDARADLAAAMARRSDKRLLRPAERGPDALHREVARAELMRRREPAPLVLRDDFDNLPDSEPEGIVPRGA